MPRRSRRRTRRLLAVFALPLGLLGVGAGALAGHAEGGALVRAMAWAAPPVFAAGLLLAMSLLGIALAGAVAAPRRP